MSARFKHIAARVITSNRHMAATAIKGLNVHNYTHGIHSRKDFQKPYTSSDDARLKVVITTDLELYLCFLV